ncbi:hypothetical protein O3W44_22710 [Pantoea sp. LMR881]|nr:hypothetical protein [Pantoea sp. LMR881]MCZ4061346.1 hypothetical protein [Pantoea sp. LMR881]
MQQTVLQQIQSAPTVKSLIAVIRQAFNRGRSSFVVTAKGDEVKTRFKLVDANDLLVSNHQDGRINENYPQELQPRDRTRFSSKPK